MTRSAIKYQAHCYGLGKVSSVRLQPILVEESASTIGQYLAFIPIDVNVRFAVNRTRICTRSFGNSDLQFISKNFVKVKIVRNQVQYLEVNEWDLVV